VVLVAGGTMGYRYREYQRGVEAKKQVMRAFSIAGGKLNHVQKHLQEVSQ
jgi:hypothetical protein